MISRVRKWEFIRDSFSNMYVHFVLLVLYKFPLVELDTSNASKRLAAAGIESSETLTLEPVDQIVQLTRGIAPPPKPILAVKEIPDDNSCLFNAIGFVLENQSLSKAHELRNSTPATKHTVYFYYNFFAYLVVARYILARPLEYTAAVLGQAPKDYALWIQQSDKWGGAIELAIFSDIYGVEIGSFDVQSGRMDLFGEGRGLCNRVYLQYTGIHYEAFYQIFNKDIITIFPSDDTQITEQIRELVMAARAAHKYTDTSLFTLRCDDCRVGLKGQTEAQKHAQQTGHFNFIEYE